jgi:hypothetical protein
MKRKVENDTIDPIDHKGSFIFNLSQEEINFLLTSIDQNTKKGIRDFILISLIIEAQIYCTKASNLNNDDVLIFWHRGRFHHYLRIKYDDNEFYSKISPQLWSTVFDYYQINKDKPTDPLFTLINRDNSRGRRLTSDEIFEIIDNHINKILYKRL